MLHDTQNLMFSLAADFVNYSSRSVFLTGRAGTGKTTFLKFIRQQTNKQVAVVAPTGVAAINAGGVTIHSFFQIPFTPFLPASNGFARSNEVIDRHHLLGHIRMNKERRDVLQKLEMLIIDEISMVRCDVLDAVDAVLRGIRSRPQEPFGGVQVLYIGDMFQLPPVAGEHEWNILSSYYRSPYFFDSKAVQEQPPVYIELDKIYRQNEQQFIDVLNKVRNNTMDKAGFDLLDSRYNPGFEQPENDDKYIVLTTHNNKADATNAAAMAKLPGEAKVYQATIEGDFNDKTYPVDALLTLRVGAQVMFIKNDGDKRFYNGKIGVVTQLDNTTVTVQCKGDAMEIEVKPEKWENIHYSVANEEVQQDVIGSFKQLPLRLAWAITIHKSQGLTFEKAIIDAGSSFAAGQVYVALSRCTTLNGIVLKSKLTNTGLRNDERIIRFAQQKQSIEHMLPLLQQSKKSYEKEELLKLFDLSSLLQQASRVKKILEEHTNSFNEETIKWFDAIFATTEEQSNVAGRFKKLLAAQYYSLGLEAEQPLLNERIVKAIRHFDEQLQPLLLQLQQSPATTDSKLLAMNYNAELRALYIQLSFKIHLLNYCETGYNIEAYNAGKKSFVPVALPVNAYAGTQSKKIDSPHPDLYRQLRQLRDRICAEMDVPIYFIAGSATLDEMARYLPQTSTELTKISGFGKVKTQQYGERFLSMIKEYCEAHELSSAIDEKKPKRERKEKKEKPEAAPVADTKQETYNLYKQQKTIEEIAALRSLTKQTIEGHLAQFVQSGVISVSELVTREKVVLIEPVLQTFDGKSLSPIKEQLGDAVSYGDIRLVLASKMFENNRKESSVLP